MFPEKYLDPDDAYFPLLTELLILGYQSTGQVATVCMVGRDHAIQCDQELVGCICDPDQAQPDWVSEHGERRAKKTGVHVTQVGLARTVLIDRHGADYRPFMADINFLNADES